MVLRGRNSYDGSPRQNRADAVCDLLVTVNAPEAEDRVLGMLREVMYSEDRLRALTEALNKRLRAAAERRAHEPRRVPEVRLRRT